jgi:hypothetical protein
MGIIPTFLADGKIHSLISAMSEERLVGTFPGTRVKHSAAWRQRIGGSPYETGDPESPQIDDPAAA